MTAVIAAPRNGRNTYWAKLIPASAPVPDPRNVESLPDLPGHYLTRGPVELGPDDVLIHAERTADGWKYGVTFVRSGSAVTLHPTPAFVDGLAKCGHVVGKLRGGIHNCLAVAQAIRQGVLS